MTDLLAEYDAHLRTTAEMQGHCAWTRERGPRRTFPAEAPRVGSTLAITFRDKASWPEYLRGLRPGVVVIRTASAPAGEHDRIIDVDEMAVALIAQTAEQGQTAVRTDSSTPSRNLRVAVRRVARERGIRMWSGTFEGVLAVVRTDADLWRHNLAAKYEEQWMAVKT